MSNTATSINTFLPEQKDNSESQQEQRLITLSIADYKNIFIQIEKLNDRISALESHQTADIERLARDIALDRQRISRLETPKIQPLQKDRREILRSLLVANGGKILAKDARKKMRVPKSSFSELLKACGFVEKRPYHLDSRQDVLVLK